MIYVSITIAIIKSKVRELKSGYFTTSVKKKNRWNSIIRCIIVPKGEPYTQLEQYHQMCVLAQCSPSHSGYRALLQGSERVAPAIWSTETIAMGRWNLLLQLF